jgi:hypothetical protein
MGKRRMAGNRGPFIVATIDQHGKWFPACWIPIEKMLDGFVKSIFA